MINAKWGTIRGLPSVSFRFSLSPLTSSNAKQVSVYFAAEAVTVLHWNRLSDHVGRKPILLFGLLGTIVSITMFGLSRSFWSLALWWVFGETPKYSLVDVLCRNYIAAAS